MSNGDTASALSQSGQSADSDFSSSEPGGATQGCGEKTWIEIQLIGEDDQPIPGEKYKVELPDGSVKEGALDSEGLAGFEGLDPGNCKVTFPDLDEEAWEPA